MIKWVTRVILFLIAIIAVGLILLIYWSPQKTELIYDNENKVRPNSISTLENVNINGVSQRLVIRGWDKSNPVLLHLHGGPGSPDRPFIKMINAHVEDIFTVVYWDQRGVGGSYDGNINPESISLDQIALDGISIAELLKERFDKEKIFIQGHSWGTAVGLTMAHKRPDLFHAYVGIGQIASSEWSEKVSYEYVLDQAHKADNQEDISVLSAIGSPPYPEDKWIENMLKQRKILWKYENPERPLQQSMFQIYMIFIMHPEYSISDKIGMLKGAELTMNQLWDDAMNIDFFTTIPEVNVPVFILQGKYDKHTTTSVAKAYFDSLKAPEKHYFEFAKSAHAPHFEEYQKYKEILEKEVLQGF